MLSHRPLSPQRCTMPRLSTPPADRPLLAFKFGGTAVGSVDRFRNVIRVITDAAHSARVLVVNSALSQVTRQLDAGFDAVTADASPSTVADDLLEALRLRHREQAAAVLSPTSQMQYASMVEQRLASLRDALGEAAATGRSVALRDRVLAIGEQLAVPMVALALHDAGMDVVHGDATTLLRTDDSFGGAAVDLTATRGALCRWADGLSPTAVPVLAGFIGGTADGATTTLGFEGSDYSAALFASVLNADRLTRYTDVDGLYTRDPRTHHDAARVSELAMEAALARTEAGELGMHPKTLRPLVDAGIALHIRSIDALDAPGTRIIPDAQLVASGAS